MHSTKINTLATQQRLLPLRKQGSQPIPETMLKLKNVCQTLLRLSHPTLKSTLLLTW